MKRTDRKMPVSGGDPGAEFLRDRRVCVTGGAGFLGSFVVKKLQERGAKGVFVPRSPDHDLVQGNAARRMVADARPDLLIHLAVRVGRGDGLEHPVAGSQ